MTAVQPTEAARINSIPVGRISEADRRVILDRAREFFGTMDIELPDIHRFVASLGNLTASGMTPKEARTAVYRKCCGLLDEGA